MNKNTIISRSVKVAAAALLCAAITAGYSCASLNLNDASIATSTPTPAAMPTPIPEGVKPTLAPYIPEQTNPPAQPAAPVSISAETGDFGDDVPLTRAAAAKTIALALLDKGVIDGFDREITFSDCNAADWFDRYVNAVCVMGYMTGKGGAFEPYGYVTVDETQALLDIIDTRNTIKMDIGANGGKPVSYALWTRLFVKLLQNMAGGEDLGGYGVSRSSVVILATPETNSRLSNGEVVTDIGALGFGGLNMERYADTLVTVLKKDGEVLVVLSADSVTPTLRNAYIVAAGSGRVTVFCGGAERTYAYGGADFNGKIADVTISGKDIIAVNAYSDSIRGVIKLADDARIELDGVMVSMSEHFRVYSTVGGAVTVKTTGDLIVGRDIADFVINDGKAVAAVITEKPNADVIRVAIQTSGFGGFVHKSAAVSSEAAFTVRYGGTIDEHKAGERADITEGMFAGGVSRVYVTAANGKVTLNGVKRAYPDGGFPAYRGTIEISKCDGGYYIVNELPMEQYLYAVIPSETPTGHGAEAAKAQAVTARSYAYAQFYANRFHQYGANVDDSVACQVYNNIPENAVSIQAADDTAGQCLLYGGNVVSANFFSTSGGVTANSGEVWASGAMFPSNTPEYLKSVKQYEGADYGDLRVEANARAFYKDTSVKGYEAAFPWFRWRVTMTASEMTESINAALKGRYEANPRLIKTLQPSGNYLSRPVDTIGDFINAEILERGEAGNALRLKIEGTAATITVATEYNIRALLNPHAATITRSDGSEIGGYSILPSAFFVMEKETETSALTNAPITTTITFFGGGNGHGAGMSQNGAKALIDKGYGYKEVLAHYYAGTTVGKP